MAAAAAEFCWALRITMSQRKNNSSHWATKRTAQLGQAIGETLGVSKSTTATSDEFQRLDRLSKQLRQDYANVVARVERYVELPSHSPLDVRALLADKSPLTKLGTALQNTGHTLGDDSTLGGAYVDTGARFQEIHKRWTEFQGAANDT